MRPARSWLAAAALAVVSALAAPALALPGGSFADREAARAISGKAYEMFEKGEWRKAIDLFQQAEARYHAPPHLLYVARAQAKLGLLIEAKGTYGRVIDEKLAADAPAPFKDAQASARAERGEVEARTPSLVVTLAITAPRGASVALDGEPIAPGDLGKPLERNPGAHVLTVEAPGVPRAEREVVLRAGDGVQRITLLARVAAPSVVPAVAAFVVGAVGLGVGTTAAVLLRSAAPGQTTALRVTEVTGFAGGGVGVGAGVVLLVVRARSSPSAPTPTSTVSAAALRGARGAFGPLSSTPSRSVSVSGR